MQFDSYLFILAFLPVSLIFFHFFRTKINWTAAKVVLLLCSFLFYGWFNWKIAVFLAVWILINYFAHKFIRRRKEDKRTSRAVGICAITLDLLLLMYFKYASFFTDSLNRVFSSQWNVKVLFVPLGISFMTFQAIAFIADSMAGKTDDYGLLDTALSFAYFPKVISGPITLPNEFITDLKRPDGHGAEWKKIAGGIVLFAIGIGKKVLLADNLGRMVNWGYANTPSLGTLGALATVIGYTLQIYFDFSGYSDMARGISMFFGFDLPVNFDSPYRSCNISDFWKRWHMTLTRFLTKYLYIPLGGNRKGTWRTYLNTMIVFTVSGLWHGAAWNFIFWGLLHGAALVIYKCFKEKIDKIHPAMQWGVNISVVSVLWVFFRADNLRAALSMLKQFLNYRVAMPEELIAELFPSDMHLLFEAIGIAGRQYIMFSLFMLTFAAIFAMLFRQKNSNALSAEPECSVASAVFYAAIMILSVCSFANVSEYVYGAF